MNKTSRKEGRKLNRQQSNVASASEEQRPLVESVPVQQYAERIEEQKSLDVSNATEQQRQEVVALLEFGSGSGSTLEKLALKKSYTRADMEVVIETLKNSVPTRERDSGVQFSVADNIEELKTAINKQDLPNIVYIAYNKEDNNWVSLCIIRNGTKIKVLYKDSLGCDAPEILKSAIIEVLQQQYTSGLDLEFIYNMNQEKREEEEGYNDGPMAIRNIKIMMYNISDPQKKQVFVDGFVRYQFCSQDDISSDRKKAVKFFIQSKINEIKRKEEYGNFKENQYRIKEFDRRLSKVIDNDQNQDTNVSGSDEEKKLELLRIIATELLCIERQIPRVPIVYDPKEYGENSLYAAILWEAGRNPTEEEIDVLKSQAEGILTRLSAAIDRSRGKSDTAIKIEALAKQLNLVVEVYNKSGHRIKDEGSRGDMMATSSNSSTADGQLTTEEVPAKKVIKLYYNGTYYARLNDNYAPLSTSNASQGEVFSKELTTLNGLDKKGLEAKIKELLSKQSLPVFSKAGDDSFSKILEYIRNLQDSKIADICTKEVAKEFIDDYPEVLKEFEEALESFTQKLKKLVPGGIEESKYREKITKIFETDLGGYVLKRFEYDQEEWEQDQEKVTVALKKAITMIGIDWTELFMVLQGQFKDVLSKCKVAFDKIQLVERLINRPSRAEHYGLEEQANEIKESIGKTQASIEDKSAGRTPPKEDGALNFDELLHAMEGIQEEDSAKLESQYKKVQALYKRFEGCSKEEIIDYAKRAKLSKLKDPDDTKRYIELAKKHMAQGKYNKALAVAKKALFMHTHCPEPEQPEQYNDAALELLEQAKTAAKRTNVLEEKDEASSESKNTQQVDGALSELMEVMKKIVSTQGKECSPESSSGLPSSQIDLSSIPCNIFSAIAAMIRANEIVTGYQLRDAQILAILEFLRTGENRFCQINTGEGKTTVTSGLAVIEALKGRYVDVITSNPVLAEDAVKDRRKFYALFDLSVTHNNQGNVLYSRGPKECYSCDVVYGTISSFAFDHLNHDVERKRTKAVLEEKGECFAERKLDTIIIDEADNITLDNFAMMTTQAKPVAGMDDLKYVYLRIWQLLEEVKSKDKDDISEDNKIYIASQIRKEFIDVTLEAMKFTRIFPKFLRDFIERKLDTWIDNAIRAKYDFRENVDYLIVNKVNKDGEDIIMPLDKQVGIRLRNFTWTDLHPFIQIKHNVHINAAGSLTSVFIPNSKYLQDYSRIFGMTGTLGSDREKELTNKFYRTECSTIPPFKGKNLDTPETKGGKRTGLKNYCVKDEDWVETVKKETIKFTAGRAVLIVCATVEDVRKIKEAFDSCPDLNLVTYEDDNDAYKINELNSGGANPGHVIIATNIGGRGTDIILSKAVVEAGGLHEITAYMPSNIRIELQAAGRAARNGEPGSSNIIMKESEFEQLRKDCEQLKLQLVGQDHGNALLERIEHLFNEIEQLKSSTIDIGVDTSATSSMRGDMVLLAKKCRDILEISRLDSAEVRLERILEQYKLFIKFAEYYSKFKDEMVSQFILDDIRLRFALAYEEVWRAKNSQTEDNAHDTKQYYEGEFDQARGVFSRGALHKNTIDFESLQNPHYRGNNIDNAFNRSDDIRYQYETNDINAIGTKLLEGARENPEVFTGALGVGIGELDVAATLKQKKELLDRGKIDKILGVYNTGGYHWVSFRIEEDPKQKEKYNVYVKDSLGEERPDLQDKINEAFGKDKIKDRKEHKIAEQESRDVSCGVFALENMTKLAAFERDKLNEFEKQGNFLAQRDIQDKRIEFARHYVEAAYEGAVKDITLRNLRKAVIEAHKEEQAELSRLLTVQGLKVEVRTRKELKNEYDYDYVVICPKDKKEEVQRQLENWFNNSNQNVEKIKFREEEQIKITLDPSWLKDIPELNDLKSKRDQANAIPLSELEKGLDPTAIEKDIINDMCVALKLNSSEVVQINDMCVALKLNSSEVVQSILSKLHERVTQRHDKDYSELEKKQDDSPSFASVENADSSLVDKLKDFVSSPKKLCTVDEFFTELRSYRDKSKKIREEYKFTNPNFAVQYAQRLLDQGKYGEADDILKKQVSILEELELCPAYQITRFEIVLKQKKVVDNMFARVLASIIPNLGDDSNQDYIEKAERFLIRAIETITKRIELLNGVVNSEDITKMLLVSDESSSNRENMMIAHLKSELAVIEKVKSHLESLSAEIGTNKANKDITIERKTSFDRNSESDDDALVLRAEMDLVRTIGLDTCYELGFIERVENRSDLDDARLKIVSGISMCSVSYIPIIGQIIGMAVAIPSGNLIREGTRKILSVAFNDPSIECDVKSPEDYALDILTSFGGSAAKVTTVLKTVLKEIGQILLFQVMGKQLQSLISNIIKEPIKQLIRPVVEQFFVFKDALFKTLKENVIRQHIVDMFNQLTPSSVGAEGTSVESIEDIFKSFMDPIQYIRDNVIKKVTTEIDNLKKFARGIRSLFDKLKELKPIFEGKLSGSKIIKLGKLIKETLSGEIIAKIDMIIENIKNEFDEIRSTIINAIEFIGSIPVLLKTMVSELKIAIRGFIEFIKTLGDGSGLEKIILKLKHLLIHYIGKTIDNLIEYDPLTKYLRRYNIDLTSIDAMINGICNLVGMQVMSIVKSALFKLKAAVSPSASETQHVTPELKGENMCVVYAFEKLLGKESDATFEEGFLNAIRPYIRKKALSAQGLTQSDIKLVFSDFGFKVATEQLAGGDISQFIAYDALVRYHSAGGIDLLTSNTPMGHAICIMRYGQGVKFFDKEHINGDYPAGNGNAIIPRWWSQEVMSDLSSEIKNGMKFGSFSLQYLITRIMDIFEQHYGSSTLKVTLCSGKIRITGRPDFLTEAIAIKSPTEPGDRRHAISWEILRDTFETIYNKEPDPSINEKFINDILDSQYVSKKQITNMSTIEKIKLLLKKINSNTQNLAVGDAKFNQALPHLSSDINNNGCPPDRPYNETFNALPRKRSDTLNIDLHTASHADVMHDGTSKESQSDYMRRFSNIMHAIDFIKTNTPSTEGAAVLRESARKNFITAVSRNKSEAAQYTEDVSAQTIFVKKVRGIQKGMNLNNLNIIKEISPSFYEYTMEEIGNILRLRVLTEGSNTGLTDTIILPGSYIFSEKRSNIHALLFYLNLYFINIILQRNNQAMNRVIHPAILAPISLDGRHAVGVMFVAQDDGSGYKAFYLDPENTTIPEGLVAILNEHGYKVEQLPTEGQRYTNCGPEVIENFMLYLTGERLSQEDAIVNNSRLIEQELLSSSHDAEEANCLTLNDSYSKQDGVTVISNTTDNTQVTSDSYIIGNPTRYDIVTPQTIIDGVIVRADLGRQPCDVLLELAHDYRINQDYAEAILGEVTSIDIS